MVRGSRADRSSDPGQNPVIEIVLTCTEDGCNRKSDPYKGLPIDTYSWHDAPMEAVMIDSAPHGWWVFDHGDGIVLCPEHSDGDNIKRHRERAWARK